MADVLFSFAHLRRQSRFLSAVIVLADKFHHQTFVAGGLLADVGVVVGAEHRDAAVDHARREDSLGLVEGAVLLQLVC